MFLQKNQSLYNFSIKTLTTCDKDLILTGMNQKLCHCVASNLKDSTMKFIFESTTNFQQSLSFRLNNTQHQKLTCERPVGIRFFVITQHFELHSNPYVYRHSKVSYPNIPLHLFSLQNKFYPHSHGKNLGNLYELIYFLKTISVFI